MLNFYAYSKSGKNRQFISRFIAKNVCMADPAGPAAPVGWLMSKYIKSRLVAKRCRAHRPETNMRDRFFKSLYMVAAARDWLFEKVMGYPLSVFVSRASARPF